VEGSYGHDHEWQVAHLGPSLDLSHRKFNTIVNGHSIRSAEPELRVEYF